MISVLISSISTNRRAWPRHLRISNRSCLLSGGAEVSVWDDDPNARKEALNENIALANPATIDWAKQDALVLSPGCL